MHILINGWFAGQDTAGSGQYIDHLLAHLPRQAANHRFTVLLPQGKQGLGMGTRGSTHGGSRPDQPPIPNLQSLPSSHRRAIPLPRLPRNLAKLWWEQITVPLAAHRLGVDVLWVPYWAAPLWRPVPIVVTVHDLIPILLPDYRGGLLQRLYFSLVSLTARRAAAVITVSQASVRDVVGHLNVPGTRVFAVHHGPNQDFSPQKRKEHKEAARGSKEERDKGHLDAVREKHNLPARYFLYLGGFDARKNVAGILQAYTRYLEKGGDPAVKLVIAGKLPETDTNFAPDPRRIAADLGLPQEQVHFTGWVDDADKPALYALATAYLFPSHYEGFGMMVLEAMAAGTPVITSAGPKEGPALRNAK